MNFFLKKGLLLFLPIFSMLVLSEAYIQTKKNTFNQKAHFLFSNVDIEGVVLGSSHAQAGINPRLLGPKVANLAYGNQDIKLDLELLKKSITQCTNIKFLVFELAYHRLTKVNPDKYWRNALYQKYYKLEGLNGTSILSNYFLSSSNLKFFKSYLLENLASKESHVVLNQFGFLENDVSGIFSDLLYDELKIERTAPKRIKLAEWSSIKKENLIQNTQYLEEIIAICSKNKIQLFLIAPPVYKTFRNEMLDEKIKLRAQFISNIKKSNPEIKWMNFEDSEYFTVRHFKNDDHLNYKGAEVFTKLLNDSLRVSRLTALNK
jgi:hypothetical protein